MCADHKRFDVLISDDDGASEMFRLYLSSTHSVKWLLVVDNADSTHYHGLSRQTK